MNILHLLNILHSKSYSQYLILNRDILHLFDILYLLDDLHILKIVLLY
jgi:hypothetical protein